MIIPKPDKFVSGSLDTGRLVLIRNFKSQASCGVLIFFGALTDNGDGTFNLDLGSA